LGTWSPAVKDHMTLLEIWLEKFSYMVVGKYGSSMDITCLMVDLKKKRMEIDEKWTRDEKIVFLLLY